MLLTCRNKHNLNNISFDSAISLIRSVLGKGVVLKQVGASYLPSLPHPRCLLIQLGTRVATKQC